MFCPYNQRKQTVITFIVYNENRQETGSVVQNTFQNAECVKEQCGAWNKGRCRYVDKK